MIRVMIVDDHPALRAGLLTVLRAEPGITAVGASGATADALTDTRHEPDVALVDYNLPDDNGLNLCRRLKARGEAPRVIVYSAHADAALSVSARLAGADGVVDKGAPADLLLDSIRVVAKGGSVFPPPSGATLQSAGQMVEPEDLAILGMATEGTSRPEMAQVLGIDAAELERRIDRMLDALAEQIGR